MVSTSFSDTLSIAAPRQPGLARRPAGVHASRYGGVVLVALLHGLVIYGFLHVLAHRVVSLPPQPIQVRVIDALKKPEEAAKPPPPKPIEMPPVYVPPPEINLATTSPAANSSAIAVTTTAKPAAAPIAAPPPAAPARVEPTLDVAHSRDPAYPPLSRRLSEQGLVALLVLVGADGTVNDVRLERSSGYPRLDEAAIDGARSGCRFKPGLIDGKPAALWYRYQYQFTLS